MRGNEITNIHYNTHTYIHIHGLEFPRASLALLLCSTWMMSQPAASRESSPAACQTDDNPSLAPPSPSPAILYRNPAADAILIDIPASIALAQHCDSDSSCRAARGNPQCRGCCTLLSSEPPAQPYPSHAEPKSERARSRVLDRVPEDQLRYQDEISVFVQQSLDNIRQNYNGGSWCLPRQIPDHHVPVDCCSRYVDTERGRGAPDKKRKLDSSGLWEMTSDGPQKLPQTRAPLVLPSSRPLGLKKLSDMQDILVQNPWPSHGVILLNNPDSQPSKAKKTDGPIANNHSGIHCDMTSVYIPPNSSFVLAQLGTAPLPLEGKFDFLLLDPPWQNRSVRRSSKYQEERPVSLQELLKDTVSQLLRAETGIIGVWTTNSASSRRTALSVLDSMQLHIVEEWVWIKTTIDGEPIYPVRGLWKKPYEVLILGRSSKFKHDQDSQLSVKRRLIAGVPDIHSRKPNLKGVLEEIFNLRDYRAIEVFARNLTSGWHSIGNEVTKYNDAEWWAGSDN